MDGAVNHSSNPKTYTAPSPKITLEAPEKAKVYFVCWRVNNATGTPVASIPAGSSGDLVFYAQWTTEEEYNIIAETNRVRTNPKAYAAELTAASSNIPSYCTPENYNAAIATLNAASTLGSLKFERGLYFAARDHAQDLINTNTFAHESSDGTTFSKRIARYGSSYNTAGENIAAGTTQNTGAAMVKQWVLSSGHLANILNSNYTQIGAAHLSGHPTYGWVGAQEFARGFVSNPLP